MSFFATKFSFDNVSSDMYGLYCGSYNGGETSSSTGSDVEIIEEYINRRAKPYFYGTKFPQKLEFPIDFFSEKPIDRYMVQAIEQWLFGHSEYKTLQFLQCDMYETYFNCILNLGNVLCVGNEVYGFSCTAVCDAPWGWGRRVTESTSGINGESIINIVNTSDDNSYLYPVLKLYSPVNQNNVSIVNESDNNRKIVFTSLLSAESIEMDADLRIVTSDKENIYDRFNSVYLRLIRGNNVLKVTGDLYNFSISYIPARKVGS